MLTHLFDGKKNIYIFQHICHTRWWDIVVVNKNSYQCLNNKIKENSVSKCKCCTKMKLELEKTLADLSSAKLIIKLLQKQGWTK